MGKEWCCKIFSFCQFVFSCLSASSCGDIFFLISCPLQCLPCNFSSTITDLSSLRGVVPRLKKTFGCVNDVSHSCFGHNVLLEHSPLQSRAVAIHVQHSIHTYSTVLYVSVLYHVYHVTRLLNPSTAALVLLLLHDLLIKFVNSSRQMDNIERKLLHQSHCVHQLPLRSYTSTTFRVLYYCIHLT